MEWAWRQTVRDAPREAAIMRPWIEDEVYAAIRKARRGHDHMTAVRVWVLIPTCDDCAHYEAHRMEASRPRPDVIGLGWELDYRLLGMTREEIRTTKRAMKGGEWCPSCRECHQAIHLDRNEFVYLDRERVESFFGLSHHKGRTTPKWMRAAVMKAFGGRCAGCRKRLTDAQATIDHIEPYSQGGFTEMSNLQPLCTKCNGEKGDRPVAVVDASLTFLLRPVPSDGYEGVVW